MAATTKWSIDPGHSKIQFKVKHLAIANVTGSFNTVSGHAMTQGEKWDGAQVYFEVEAGSIDTNNGERDNHLKSELFLDAGRFNDTRAGFEVSGKFNRKDFGLNFNLRTDVGSLVVGEEVRISGDIELIRM